MVPDEATLALISTALGYDPATGEMHWIVDRPPAIKAGRAAGSYNGPNRDWYVMVNGRRYPMHRVAWFLMRHSWPRHRVIFRDGNHDNLTWANLGSEEERYSKNPAAVAYRKRKADFTLKRQRAAKDRARTIQWRGNIDYDQGKDKWVVFALNAEGMRVTVKEFASQGEAEEFSEDMFYATEYVDKMPYLPQRNDAFIMSGANPHSASYLELAEVMAYDPLSGHFFYRTDLQTPIADHLSASGRRVVSFWGRYYSVGMLAWFFTHRRWPAPRSIGFKDGDSNNARLANLYEKKR